MGWALSGAFAPLFLWLHPLDLPSMDEWTLLAPTLDGWGADWLFAPHYGHRIPVPRLALVTLFSIGGLGAIRLASGLAPWAAAAILIGAATRARGRPHALDVLLPALLSGPALAFSTLHGFDLHFGLQLVLASGALRLLIEHARRPHPARFAGACALIAGCLGCGVDGQLVGAALACALPIAAGPSLATLGAAACLGTSALLAIPTDELHVRASPLVDQLRTAWTTLAMPLGPPNPLVALGCGAWGLALAARLRSVPRLAPRHRRVAQVAGLATLGALAVIGAVAHAHARGAAEPDPPLRYASLAAQVFAFAHVFLLASARGPRGGRAPIAPATAALVLVGCLIAMPAHVSRARALGAWTDRVEAETSVAIRSGWTPAELALHFGDDLYPYDRSRLERWLARWLDRRALSARAGS